LKKPVIGMKKSTGNRLKTSRGETLHLGIDPHLNMRSVAVTDYSASDISMVDDLRNIKAPVEKVISDGAYYKYSWRSNT